MEATCSSETSVYFQRTTWRYIPEDITFLLVFVWFSFRCRRNPESPCGRKVHDRDVVESLDSWKQINRSLVTDIGNRNEILITGLEEKGPLWISRAQFWVNPLETEKRAEKAGWGYRHNVLGERGQNIFSGFEGSQAVPARPSGGGCLRGGEVLWSEKVIWLWCGLFYDQTSWTGPLLRMIKVNFYYS
jgi:hypothetical protein